MYREGQLLAAVRDPSLGGRRHFHLDHLGTPRLVTADNGLRISLHDYFPFGDEATPVSQEVAAGYDREDPMKFTGHERDFAWGTSSRSSKLVHGGLRYLKEGKLQLTRESVHERQNLLAQAAGLVEPQDFDYGKHEGSHSDPDGNLIRFGSPLRPPRG